MNPLDRCPSCFSELKGKQFCGTCGYDVGGARRSSRALPLFSKCHGRYLAGRVIESCSRYVLYASYDLKNEAHCLMKEYLPGISGGQAAFPREVSFLKRGRSSGIVPELADTFEENGRVYLIFPPVRETVQAYIRKQGGELDPEFAMHLLSTLATGLAQLHRSGVLHRAIRPECIMLDSGGRVLLTDFSNAVDLNSPQPGLPGRFEGFTAPECCNSGAKQGTWSDVYSLCATFYFLISGRKPPSAASLQIGSRLPSLWELNYPVSRMTSDAIAYGMEPDRRQRCPSFDVLLTRLDVPVKTGQVIAAQAPRGVTVPVRRRPAGPGLRGVVTLQDPEGASSMRLPDGATLLIGRSRSSCRLICREDIRISKEHCRIRFDGRERCFHVTDLSSNGTFRKDGSRLPKGQSVKLQPGAQIYLAVPRHMVLLSIRE